MRHNVRILQRRTGMIQPDILEWCQTQQNSLKILAREQYKLEKGFVYYFNQFSKFIKEYRNPPPKAEVDDEKSKKSGEAMNQFYESQELCKYIKWKRVSWEEDADYPSFAKKILDNDDMFKRIPAFSFMSVHVVKDPSTNQFVTLPEAEPSIEAGMLSNWVLKERDPKPVELYKPTQAERKSPFSVDWSSGEVRILDTASAQEILTFLLTTAPRLQAVQLKMEDQQKRIVEKVEHVRVRVGATVKFNDFDSSFWDDPKRKGNPNYINPDQVEMFCKEVLRTAFLYRLYLKRQHIRVVPPGRPYYADFEKNEVQIPANFGQFNWLKAHTSFQPFENTLNSFRRFWWFWFCLGLVLVGDVELL